MKKFSNEFRPALREMRQLNAIVSYSDPNGFYILTTENNDNLLTEDLNTIIVEGGVIDYDKETINSVNLLFNTSLFKTTCKSVQIECKNPISKGTNIEVRIGVYKSDENKYEYLNYGKFYISKEPVYQADSDSYLITGYDKMIESMVSYDNEPLSITFPIKHKDFVIAICNKFGWSYDLINYPNANKNIVQDFYKGQNLTYRDILDDLNGVCGGSFMFDLYNKLTWKRPTETNQIVEDDDLKDVNVDFAEKYGKVNVLTITTNGNVVLDSKEDTQSIQENGRNEFNVNDNYILNYSTDDFIDEMFNEVNGLEYYLYDVDSTGLLIFEPLDMFTFRHNNIDYKTIMFNDDIKLTQGLVETTFAEKPEEEKKDYKTTDKDKNKLNNAVISLDKANAQIILKVDSDGKIVQVRLDGNADDGSVFNVKADNIKLEGYTTINDSFKIDNKGSMFVDSNITWERNYTQEDVNILRQILVDGTTPTKAQLEYYDANGNGILDINDLLLVQKVVLGTNPSTRVGKLKINSYNGYNTFVIYDETNDKNGVRFGIDGGFIKNLNSENFLIGGKLIVESGSNDDGEYVKFYDGTMICRGIVKLTSNEQKTSGGLTYYCADTYINFPFEFSNVDVQKIQMTSEVRHENMNYICNTYAVPQSKTQARISLQTTQKNYKRGIMWTAIGKWK
uniref:Uncharacterized protein n=1 Tax=Siphoviridae sp. ctt8434 TaxID=2825703 RepID=A0A8S5U1J0_9CAUD|nr:MAG TPA: hypothetical protein [Siphoviridae sp. ctt8434]